ncbi:MAG: N-6 DNA methylase [Bacteroidaceae bacterium]|nr:N-6 DNA methylase [Bacteroidaceae bacterium]
MLFQKTIVKKFQAMLSEEQTLEAWQKYQSYFLDKNIQANIRQSKEEQFQEGFLRELFVKVLDYTLNPSPDYNLITEQKNETNAKKADGAILQDGKVIGVIELKDHKTTDLSRIETQAFGYKSQHPQCRLVIISNFEKLRLYIDHSVDYREWNLFTLDEAEFNELYLCLALPQVYKGIAVQMKQDTKSVEEQVTNALYKDYSQFKRVLFADILANNPAADDVDEKEWQLLLFKKTQKLLDRMLFIFFAEDCDLLPPNSMVMIIDQWKQLKELDAYVPLYERIKKYFGYLDTGHQGKKYEIYAYNGGLFKPDPILDKLLISDDLLAIHTEKLASYDYASEVDVNILGHIFENSLTEIEEVTQQITNGDAPKTSRRKQDGVFYTPQYITKYIVENTVGKLCAEKKQELGIVEEDYFSDQRRQMQTKLKMLDKLGQYREWLKEITILDPACGSGAFLNAALRFLIDEHQHIDKLENNVTGHEIPFEGVEKEILEHNLYGVDINEESVEIAQLSLWLRTAKKHRKLNSLNENIKCGNSLISDPAIAGDKAFDWQKEFPQVFEKGGFDVVIGNPPYVNMANILNEQERKYYQKSYSTVKNKCDLYSIFTERAKSLLIKKGLLGFIFPNSWMGTESFSKFRDFLSKEVSVYQLVELPPGVFEDAIVTTVLCFYKNIEPLESSTVDIFTCINKEFVRKNFVLSYEQILKNPNSSFAFEKTISLEKVPCKSLADIALFSLGIKTSDDARFVYTEPIDNTCYKFIRGRNISRWSHPSNNEWLWYQPALICEKPGGRPRVLENFLVDRKIVVQDIATQITATIDDEKYLCNDTLNIIYSLDEGYSFEYILCLLNSSLINVWFKKIFPAGLHVKTNQLEQIPIPIADKESQQPFIALADKMLTLNKELQEKRGRFLSHLSNNIEGVKITTALQNFDQLDFKEFVAELKKQKVKLSLAQQDEWMDFFNQYKSACNDISSQIAETDQQIDLMVYRLYDLSYEEVLTVDPSTTIKPEDY